MRTMNISPYDKGVESRSTQHNWVRQDLKDVKESSSVGIVTFKALKKEFKELVESLGYGDVRTAHYGNLRSLNDLKDSDVLILMGCPTPNDKDIVPEAQAFFHDEPPLATGWNTSFGEQWNLKNGGKLFVKMGVYEDDKLNSYQVQKVEWELYQALHRSRPIRVTSKDKQLVLVYTNVPIPETKVTTGTGRWGITVEGIQSVLGENEKCTPPRAALAAPWLDVKSDSQAKWIRQYPHELAALAGVEWDGKNFRTKP
jgi:hypothetical protein